MILVDTSVWIDFFRGENSPERRILHELIEDEEEISITGIILTEILQGIKEERKMYTIRSYLLEFPVYDPNGIDTYINAAGIYRICRSKGRTIRSTVDCIISAICLENDLYVFHKDRDYDIIHACTGLKVL
ncbi:MAG: PIN domain nuclease [Dehalococcoidales bacterium]|nr:PIN domain nuclease [Dehalococcoidales bacterium]